MSDAVIAALGIALSPFAVIPAVLLLMTPRPRPTSAAFAGGWFVGVACVTVVAVLVADVLTLPAYPPAWLAWVRVVLGVALVMLGGAKLIRRGGQAKQPAWMAGIRGSTPRSALRLGLVASALNPKVVLLALAGGLSLAVDLSGGTEAVAALVFALVSSITTVIPLVVHVALGDRALEALSGTEAWLTRNADTLVSVVLVALGLLLATKGLSQL